MGGGTHCLSLTSHCLFYCRSLTSNRLSTAIPSWRKPRRSGPTVITSPPFLEFPLPSTAFHCLPLPSMKGTERQPTAFKPRLSSLFRRQAEAREEPEGEGLLCGVFGQLMEATRSDFVLTRAADCSAKSAQAPRPYRQALVKTIWRGLDRVCVCGGGSVWEVWGRG